MEKKNRYEMVKSNIDKKNYFDKKDIIINEVRFMIEDICPYSCEWCAVYGYKQEKKNGKAINLNEYGNNEGALVQNKSEVISRYLTVEDYKFLIYIFYTYFNTNDVTLTGGEALYSKNYLEISKEISKMGSNVSVLTKGAGLFNENGIEKIKYTDRIIFSLDTLDNEEHYKLNLPLKNKKNALKYLDKTINTINQVNKIGKNITINTVITPEDNEEKFLNIINFCISNDIENLKFIELDSSEVKNPYIEKKFLKFLEKGLLDKKNILDIDIEIRSSKKHIFMVLKTVGGKKLKVGTYRLTCAEEYLFNLEKQKNDKNHKKSCDIGRNGSITINTTGEIIPCTALPNKKISLVEFIKNKDILGLVNKISDAVKIIEKQKCPILFN